MTEGLGQKYGAPRRRAQEKLRTEMTRCDNQLAEIERLLKALEGLCGNDETSSDASPPDHQAGGKQESNHFISQNISVTLIQLRKRMLDMSKYLEFINDEKMSLPALAGQEGLNFQAFEDDCDSSMMAERRFDAVITSIAASCREDTITLFKQEGKQDELPNGDVPESLRHYLDEQKVHAQEFKLSSQIRLRKSVDLLQQILLRCPTAALGDVNKRFLASATSAESAMDKEFATKYEALETLRQRHNQNLRPQLSNPNAQQQLKLLLEQEEQRGRELISLIAEYHSGRVENERITLQNYAKAFLETFSNLVILLDSCLTRYLPSIISSCPSANESKARFRQVRFSHLARGQQ